MTDDASGKIVPAFSGFFPPALHLRCLRQRHTIASYDLVMWNVRLLLGRGRQGSRRTPYWTARLPSFRNVHHRWDSESTYSSYRFSRIGSHWGAEMLGSKNGGKAVDRPAVLLPTKRVITSSTLPAQKRKPRENTWRLAEQHQRT